MAIFISVLQVQKSKLGRLSQSNSFFHLTQGGVYV